VNILVLGGGLQGRAVLYDLARSSSVEAVACADVAVDRVQAYLGKLHNTRLRAVKLDATDAAALRALIAGSFDVVIDMLPRQFALPVAEATLTAGVHLVNSHYDHAVRALADRATDAGIAILAEMGMDPGIDLVLGAEAVRRFDRVTRLDSYGGGVPEPGADENPLRYRISWAWDGVLDSYVRPARFLRDGVMVKVPGSEIFNEDHIHTIKVDPLGTLEAFPNGDAVGYAAKFGITESIRTIGRYALRWPGHADLWRTFARLGFLEDTPVPTLSQITPREFMHRHLEPRLQYRPEQRDVVVIRVVAEGEGYRSPRLALDVIDYRDTDSGLMAMNRTVGFPASIAAQMIASGVIKERGLLSPIRHVPFEPFRAELQKRGIHVRETSE
jgi:saccharopine dehydrogenase-like NADP-dependent oxidoreductase